MNDVKECVAFSFSCGWAGGHWIQKKKSKKAPLKAIGLDERCMEGEDVQSLWYHVFGSVHLRGRKSGAHKRKLASRNESIGTVYMT